MKTYRQLQEDISGVTQTVMPPAQLALLQKFAAQVTAAFQPELDVVFDKIDAELMKYGYTLGRETGADLSDSDGDDFLIYSYATGDVIKNVFVSVDWEKVSGQQTGWPASGSKMRYDVDLTFNAIDPAEMDQLLSDDTEIVEPSI